MQRRHDVLLHRLDEQQTTRPMAVEQASTQAHRRPSGAPTLTLCPKDTKVYGPAVFSLGARSTHDAASGQAPMRPPESW